MNKAVFACLLGALSVLWASLGNAKELPLWELVLGGGALTVPEYRGSDNSRNLPFPFIYPLYRGDRLRIDDEGVRGVLYESGHVNFDFSADANTDVDSEGSAREGMPDLDPTLQLGPLLQVRLATNQETPSALFLNIPVRGVFAVNLDRFDHVGLTFSPHVTYYRWLDFFGRNWRLGLTAGLEFADAEFHDYYYRVDPVFATATRPADDADAGYGGTRFIATLVSRNNKSWISLFMRYDRFDGAVFEDSPLVERSDGLSVGFIYARIVARSKRRVQVDEWRSVSGEASGECEGGAEDC